MLTGTFPGFNKAVREFVARPGGSVLTRAGAYAAGNITAETGVELFQEHLIPALVQDITQAGGDVSWLGDKGVLMTVVRAVPDTFSSVLLLGTVGSGAATWRDVKFGQELMSNPSALMSVGYSDAQTTTILAQPDAEAKQAKMRELWSQRAGTPATVEAAARSLSEQGAEMRAVEQQAEAEGLMPTIGRTDSGYAVHLDKGARVMVFPTLDEAREFRAQWMEQKQRESTVVPADEAVSAVEQPPQEPQGEPLTANEDGTPAPAHQPIQSPVYERTPSMASVEERAQKDGTWMKAPNGERSSLSEEQWTYARTPEFKEKFGDWEAVGLKRFLDGAPVAKISGNEFSRDARPLIDRVVDFWTQGYNNKVTHPVLGEVAMTKRGVLDSWRHGRTAKKAAVFAAVPAIIQQGRILARQPGYRGGTTERIIMAAPIDIGGKSHLSGVILMKDVNTQRFYVHDAWTKEEVQNLPNDGTESNSQRPGTDSAPLLSFVQNAFSVNLDSVTGELHQNGEPTAQQVAEIRAQLEVGKAQGDDGKTGQRESGPPERPAGARVASGGSDSRVTLGDIALEIERGSEGTLLSKNDHKSGIANANKSSIASTDDRSETGDEDRADKPLKEKHSLRLDYERDVIALREMADSLDPDREKIARQAHARRNELKILYRDLTPPDMLSVIEARNITKYGNPLGPTIEQLRAKGKTWDQIIESASRPGGGDLDFSQKK